MQIKRKINFDLRQYGKEGQAYMIRIRVSYAGQRLTLATGCSVNCVDAWDTSNQLVVDGYVDNVGRTALSINNALRNIKDQMATSFAYFEANDIMPSLEQLKEKFKSRLGQTTPKRETIKKLSPSTKEPSFFEVFDLFINECGRKNAWTMATKNKMLALRNDLITFDKNWTFKNINDSTLTAFVEYLRDKKHLRTPRKAKGEREEYDEDDVTGLLNSTIQKKLGYFRWYMKWATDSGYNSNQAYKAFEPKLKHTQKKVIYFTKDELSRLREMTFDESSIHLQYVRDVLLFCCFTGLRHSDVYNLKKVDIKEDHIEITTQKTADSLSIELNDVSREILKKYNNTPGDKALPCVVNQAFNRDLKDLCRMANINDEVRLTTYKGSIRIDKVYKKWELVGSHCGRRTFIVNALSMGIAPNIVMKWTGHSSYSSMQPYIDIVDGIKASSMQKFNNFI